MLKKLVTFVNEQLQVGVFGSVGQGYFPIISKRCELKPPGQNEQGVVPERLVGILTRQFQEVNDFSQHKRSEVEVILPFYEVFFLRAEKVIGEEEFNNQFSNQKILASLTYNKEKYIMFGDLIYSFIEDNFLHESGRSKYLISINLVDRYKYEQYLRLFAKLGLKVKHCTVPPLLFAKLTNIANPQEVVAWIGEERTFFYVYKHQKFVEHFKLDWGKQAIINRLKQNILDKVKTWREENVVIDVDEVWLATWLRRFLGKFNEFEDEDDLALVVNYNHDYFAYDDLVVGIIKEVLAQIISKDFFQVVEQLLTKMGIKNAVYIKVLGDIKWLVSYVKALQSQTKHHWMVMYVKDEITLLNELYLEN